MKRIALVLLLLGLCTAVAESADPATTEKARLTLCKETYELFKDQIKDEYPSHVTAFAIAQARITVANTTEYCPPDVKKLL